MSEGQIWAIVALTIAPLWLLVPIALAGDDASPRPFAEKYAERLVFPFAVIGVVYRMLTPKRTPKPKCDLCTTRAGGKFCPRCGRAARP